jgi:transcriptional regulator with XRE-family HTH domain
MSTQPVDGPGWIPTDDTFGARLALVRQRMGWTTVAEAAMACGIPTKSWRNWECAEMQPRSFVGRSELIAQRTGVDIDWLIRGVRKPGAPTTPNGGKITPVTPPYPSVALVTRCA